MGLIIKKKRINEDDIQPQNNNTQQGAQPAGGTTNQPQQGAQQPQNNDDYQSIENNISSIMVSVVESLQETFKAFNEKCPEIEAASKDQQSPIVKESDNVMKAIQGFLQGKADAKNLNTVNAGFQAFGNIAKNLNELVKKLQEQSKVQQQQQQQVAQNPVTDSYHYSDFGDILTEKMQHADLKNIAKTMLGGFEF